VTLSQAAVVRLARYPGSSSNITSRILVDDGARVIRSRLAVLALLAVAGDVVPVGKRGRSIRLVGQADSVCRGVRRRPQPVRPRREADPAKHGRRAALPNIPAAIFTAWPNTRADPQPSRSSAAAHSPRRQPTTAAVGRSGPSLDEGVREQL